MKFELEPYHRNISNEDLINDILRVAKLLRKNSIANTEYREYGDHGLTTIIRRFGSWSNAVKKAGLRKTKEHNIPIEELFKNIEDVWIKLGHQPRFKEVEKPLSKYSVGAYVCRFGTWRKALEQFVEYVNKEEILTTKELASKPIVTKSHKTSRDISLRLRFIVMRRDDFKCKICGRSPATESGLKLEVDHIIPWSKNGETVIENLQTLCSNCNSGKSNLDFKSKRKK